MDVSSSLRPFPSPHIVLNAGLQVASEKISIKTAKQKNSDIELQAYAGNLFSWIIMVHIKYFNVPRRPHTQLFFRISRCRAHRRSHCSFPFIRRSFFCPAFCKEIREILTGNRAAVTHSTIFPRDANRSQ